MTVKLYGIAKHTNKYIFITEGKEYPIVKITYPKLNPEGLVTIIDDHGNLNRMCSTYFTFITK